MRNYREISPAAVICVVFLTLLLGSCSKSGGDAESGGISAGTRNNALCVAGDSSTPYVLDNVFADITLSSPVRIAQVPGAPDAPFYILEKDGRIVYASYPGSEANTESRTAAQLLVNTELESGATGIAFHPEFVTNGRVFISYGTSGSSSNLELRVSEFQRAADGISFINENILLAIPKDNPFHFGGDLVFGQDGYLYIGVGDDGSNLFGDTHPMRAQDPTNVYGSILRIDVNSRPGDYSIPEDNPIFANQGRGEVWAYGFRNPWTLSFDSEAPSGLWVGDVGWYRFEEINLVESGQNHGWPICEGNCESARSGLVDPFYTYPHAKNSSVIGGYVYRGNDIPELYGKYVFADFIDNVIRVLDTHLLADDPDRTRTIISGTRGIASFAQGNDLELYAVSVHQNSIFRLEKTESETLIEPPAKLSQTGCFDSLVNGNPIANSGAHEYFTAHSFWSDGATKKRLIAIPNGTKLSTDNPDNWVLPKGGVTIKHFYLDKEIIETRFFVRYNDGTYGGYTFEWNEEKSEAYLVDAEGKRKSINGKTWHYPARNDCFQCHTEQAGYSLSLETRQLNIELNKNEHNFSGEQLQRFKARHIIPNESVAAHASLVRNTDLDDDSINIENRAKSFLHVNCASCHRGPGSAGRSTWDARYKTPIQEMGICDSDPFELTNILQDPAEKIVLPGNHQLSTLWLRTMERNSGIAMPPLATDIIDEAASLALQRWIAGMNKSCKQTGL